jgi:hypothetical protein
MSRSVFTIAPWLANRLGLTSAAGCSGPENPGLPMSESKPHRHRDPLTEPVVRGFPLDQDRRSQRHGRGGGPRSPRGDGVARRRISEGAGFDRVRRVGNRRGYGRRPPPALAGRRATGVETRHDDTYPHHLRLTFSFTLPEPLGPSNRNRGEFPRAHDTVCVA